MLTIITIGVILAKAVFRIVIGHCTGHTAKIFAYMLSYTLIIIIRMRTRIRHVQRFYGYVNSLVIGLIARDSLGIASDPIHNLSDLWASILACKLSILACGKRKQSSDDTILRYASHL